MVMVLLLRRMEMHPTPRLHRKSKGSQYPRPDTKYESSA